MLKAYKEKAKTKKKYYCYNGDDNGSCDSDYSDSTYSTSDEDETLQVLMSMTEGMLKGRLIYPI
jgi:hypothetical protein